MSGRLLDTVTLGPRRRRKQMAKRLAELDRLDRAAALRLPTKPKTHRFASFVVVLVFALAVTGVVLVARDKGATHSPTPAGSQQQVLSDDSANHAATSALTPRNANAPTPGVGEQASRLLPAPTAPAGTGGYKLLNPRFGPPRYDPCRAIHYVIRNLDTPTGGDDTIRQAVAAVSKATGLRFIEDAPTTETPTPKRAAYLPARYGNRWAPVLIAWTNPTEIPRLAGDIDGLGGSSWYAADPARGYAYVSGQIDLDTPQLTALQATPNGTIAEKLVIEHELGHLVGLDHVKDTTQIMNPYVEGLTDYRTGDLRGLAYEGSGACHPEI